MKECQIKVYSTEEKTLDKVAQMSRNKSPIF